MNKKTIIDLNDNTSNIIKDEWGIDYDKKYTFFYDASNDCRKFWSRDKKKGFNTDYNTDFVLAGVAYGNPRPLLSFDDLRKKLRLQPNVEEIRFKKQFAQKNFLECLEKKRLQTLIKWMNDNKLYIHYLNVNNLFYSLVEIFDSITSPKEIEEFGFDYLEMNSKFFDMFKGKEEALQLLMHEYEYPNIKRDNLETFAKGLLCIFPASYQHTMEEKYLIHCIERAASNKEMFFLHDNRDYIMQENYLGLYIDVIRNYKNSQHYFDEEDGIKKQLEEYVFQKEGKRINSFSFVNSKMDMMVQISDIIAGIVGKMFIYANENSATQIRADVFELTGQQLKCAKEFGDIRRRSNEENSGFLYSIAPLSEIRKVNLFFEEVNRRMQE